MSQSFKKIRLGCAAALIFLVPSISVAQLAKDKQSGESALTLQTLEDFHSAERALARTPIGKAEEKHRIVLGKYQKEAKEAGNLKSWQAADLAITDLNAGRPVLLSEDPGVAKLEKAYLAERKSAEAESLKSLAKIDQDHLASLNKLVVELTKAGQIEDAIKAQKAADQFSAQLKSQNVLDPSNQADESADLAPWKKKALTEFPSLNDPNSELSRKVKALREAKKMTNPGFFANPQWPYELAKEASRALPPAVPVRGNLQIPAEAKSFKGKRYFVYMDKCSWHTACKRCEKLGGQLVVIPDKVTQTFVSSLTEGRLLWLGATDEKKEGDWLWVDGTKMKFKNFNLGEPNNLDGKENFLAINYKNNSGDWSDSLDEGRDNVTGYVCEWPDK